MPNRLHRDASLDGVPDEDWEVARNQERVIRHLIASPPAYGARGEMMSAAALELKISAQYLYRLLRAYAEDPRTRTLLPQYPGRKLGTRTLDSRVEAIIDQEIQNKYLKLLKPNKTRLCREIRALCDAENLRKPAYDTIVARIGAISKREQTKRREGSKKAKEQFDPIQGSLEVNRPLELIQIDHTPCDVMAVEPGTGEVIGRPIITLALDVRTRMYCGVYLTFDAPSTVSVAACLVRAVMDKEPLLEAHGLPARWPVNGKPEGIHVDNAKEFHGKAFTRACEDHGIKVRYRPPGAPWFGGHVERRIGHLMQELHKFPGTTFSNIKERGIYDSEGNACLTIDEIEFLVTTIILEHHSSFHEGIGTTPEAKWLSETREMTFRMPHDLRSFYRDFLPFEDRVVQRDGIHLFAIAYWHDALVHYLNEKHAVRVHYDPTNLSKVFIRGHAGDFIEVPYRNLTRPPVTKWEVKASRKALRREGKLAVDESMIFDMILRRRKVIDAVSPRSRRARLARARGVRVEGAAPQVLGIDPARQIEGNHPPLIGGLDDDLPVSLPYFESESWDD